jgi:hypothetical protein
LSLEAASRFTFERPHHVPIRACVRADDDAEQLDRLIRKAAPPAPG